MVVALFVLTGLTGDADAKRKRRRAAKKQVVVLQFTGPKGKVLRKGVLKLIKKSAKVVSDKRFKKMQKRLKARKITDSHISKVSKRMGVHGVVVGKVKRQGGKYKLTLELREGNSGEVSKSLTLNLGRKPKLTARHQKQIRKKFLPSIKRLPDLDKEQDDEPAVVDDDGGWSDDSGSSSDDDEPVADTTDYGGMDDDDDEPTRTASRDSDDEDPLGSDDDADIGKSSDDDDGEGSLADSDLRAALARDRGVDLRAGVSFSARNLTFTISEGATGPSEYKGAMVVGAYVAAELYPMSLGKKKLTAKKSPLAGLGVGFVYDKVLKVSSKAEGSDVDIPTTQQRFGIDLLYRYNFGTKASSPSLKAHVGYGKLAFTLDKAEATAMNLTIDLPNVEYGYLSGGAAFRLPLGDKLALVADASLLVISGTGEIQEITWYGGADVVGMLADVGVEYRLGTRLFARAGAQLARIAYTFKGTGDRTKDADGNVIVGGALDQFIGGYATAGYVF